MLSGKYGDDNERKKAYDSERKERWSLEESLLEPVAKLLCEIISRDKEAGYKKYAEELITTYKKENPGNDIPGYILGAPDILIEIENTSWFVEIKIKRTRYKNTIKGTRQVMRYGCPSHYLDIIPVYENILSFTSHFQIPKNRFFVLYCVNSTASNQMAMPLIERDWEFEGISLSSLEENVNNNRYQRYGQGYGQIAWLISCNDLSNLSTLFEMN